MTFLRSRTCRWTALALRAILGALLVLAACVPTFAATAVVAKGQSFGDPASPILIELYCDFECHDCAAFHNQFLPELMRTYVETGKAHLIVHNPSFHTHSSEATGYALAAVRIGKYRDVADALFRHQAEWSASGKVWDAVAVVLNAADRKEVAELAKDPAILAEVQAETGQARDRIRQTPAMLVTHATMQRRFEGAKPPWDIFRDWVDYDLLKK